ncbi:hydrolase, haloacid dehalogenase-like family [Lachnospiraceae bacterium KM106-2]|nr:hydrolase, haloacid dehalogenase-like family [Lachnospiraceae bacterium KM106-2]
MLKAVIFDMDGVIIDSEPTNLRALHQALLACGIHASKEYCDRFIGCSLPNTASIAGKDFSTEINTKVLQTNYIKYQTELIQSEGYQPIYGTVALIKELHQHGIKLAIASSSSIHEIRQMAESLNLIEYFDELVSGHEVEHSKPSPDVFLLAAKRLNMQPEECLIIEDSMNGTLAAKAANITCIGFQNTNSGNQDLSKAYSIVLDMDGIDYSYVLEQHCHAHNLPFTVLTTSHVTVRELAVNDIDALIELYECESAKTYLPPLSSREEELEKLSAYIRHMYHFTGFGLWGVFLNDSQQLIGRIGIQSTEIHENTEVELGYFIHDDYQRQGLASEVISSLLPLVKERFELESIVAKITPNNQASIQLAQKFGFIKEEFLLDAKNNYDLYRLVLI